MDYFPALRPRLRPLLTTVDTSRVDLAPEHNATPSGITYGRRKQVPFLIVVALSARQIQVSPKIAFGVIGAVVGFYALLCIALAVFK